MNHCYNILVTSSYANAVSHNTPCRVLLFQLHLLRATPLYLENNTAIKAPCIKMLRRRIQGYAIKALCSVHCREDLADSDKAEFINLRSPTLLILKIKSALKTYHKILSFKIFFKDFILVSIVFSTNFYNSIIIIKIFIHCDMMVLK